MRLLESLGLSREQSFVVLLVIFVILVVLKKLNERQGQDCLDGWIPMRGRA